MLSKSRLFTQMNSESNSSNDVELNEIQIAANDQQAVVIAINLLEKADSTLQLPNELLQKIFNYVELKDLLALRKSCKLFNINVDEIFKQYAIVDVNTKAVRNADGFIDIVNYLQMYQHLLQQKQTLQQEPASRNRLNKRIDHTQLALNVLLVLTYIIFFIGAAYATTSVFKFEKDYSAKVDASYAALDNISPDNANYAALEKEYVHNEALYQQQVENRNHALMGSGSAFVTGGMEWAMKLGLFFYKKHNAKVIKAVPQNTLQITTDISSLEKMNGDENNPLIAIYENSKANRQ